MGELLHGKVGSGEEEGDSEGVYIESLGENSSSFPRLIRWSLL